VGFGDITMLEKVKVTGVKYYDDEIDGKSIDSGSVFVEESLDITSGRAKGRATQKYPLANSQAAKAIMHNEFPLVCEAEFIRVTDGIKSKTVVNAIKPIQKAA
jgi:metal-dependent HD superfamily phosphatase/phosphodiesterase